MTIKHSFSLMRVLAFISGALLLTACNGMSGLDSYYLPSAEVDSSLILEYRISGSREGREFWRMINYGDSVAVELLDGRAELRQRSVEFMGNDGVNQLALMLTYADSAGNTTTIYPEIIYDDLFPFDPLDSLHVYIHKIRWEENMKRKELIRNRRYFGMESIKTQLGTFRAAKFKLDELYRDEKEGFLELQFEGWEYYAEDKGLVLKTRSIGEGVSERKELVGIHKDIRAAGLLPETKSGNH